MRHNSVATILSIVLSINRIYTKSIKICHRHPYRLPIISPIKTVSRLSVVNIYSSHCTKYLLISYKNCYKWSLYFGLAVSTHPMTHLSSPP